MPQTPPTPSTPSTPFDDRGVSPALAGTRFGEVRWFSELDSTNRYLLDEAAAGAAEGLVAVADAQTAGRGRLGRSWQAPPGASLLVSVLLRPRLPRDAWHWLTLAAGLAAVEAVEAVAGIEARLKWPNDVVVGDRKLAGLLAEAEPSGGLVVGMGLNVAWSEFPPELAGIATSCNLEAPPRPPGSPGSPGLPGRPLSVPDLLVAWLAQYDVRLGALDADARSGFEGLRAACVARSATLDRRVRVELGDRSFEGVAVGLTPVGFLEVRRDDGGNEVVTAGDVAHLHPLV